LAFRDRSFILGLFVMAPVGVLYSFARSGGTLLNRCLGSVDGNLVLSEVNPHGALVPLEVQARDWLGLLGPEQERIEGDSYGAKIRHLVSLAEGREERLIIRDWTTLNFLRGLHFDYSDPSMLLEQDIYLGRYGLERSTAVLVRRAAAVYESIVRTFDHFHDLGVAEFGAAYATYARAVAGQPVVQFETFCAHPQREMERICGILGAAYAENFVSDFSTFDRCTGDNQLATPSRAGGSESIVPLPDNDDSPAWKAAAADANCRIADELFGYAG
jgi:hypothetical protein